MYRCIHAGKTTGQLEAHLTGRAPESLEPQCSGLISARLVSPVCRVWNKENAQLILSIVGLNNCRRVASAFGLFWSSCEGISLEGRWCEVCVCSFSIRARSLLVVAGTSRQRCRIISGAADSCLCGVWLLPPRVTGSLRERALRGNSYEIISLRRHGNKGCCSTTEK